VADGDTVEPKNLGRQNFVQADLGENKAIALAKRYSGAFGIPIRAIPGMLEDVRGLLRQKPEIILGCVDKHAARRMMAEYMAQSLETVWIDAGNESVAGQVVCGYTGKTTITPAALDGVPMPVAMPTISQLLELPVGGEVRPSCAEMIEVTEQVSTVNVMAATLVTNFLRLVLEDVKRVQLRQPVKGIEFGSVFFNVGNGGATTQYNVPKNLELARKKMCPWN
jgi:molybdopterin/thiamine biosynthesis adenylyltransferase